MATHEAQGGRLFWRVTATFGIICPGAFLLVDQRPQRAFSLLAPRTQPKFAAALPYEPQTWCTKKAKYRLTRFLRELLTNSRSARLSSGSAACDREVAD